MKKYNKEVSRYDENSNEVRYTSSVCKLEFDLSMELYKQQFVMKENFELKSHKDNFNKNIY